MKITIASGGYVGLSMAVLLAQRHEVVANDLSDTKVDQINCQKSPTHDSNIERYLTTQTLDLPATTDKHDAFVNAHFVVIGTPTDYDSETNYFNTRSVESVIEEVKAINRDAHVVIKSTTPEGFTARQALASRRNFCAKAGCNTSI